MSKVPQFNKFGTDSRHEHEFIGANSFKSIEEYVLMFPMLTIRCAGCKRKLFRYDKIGNGAVLRCFLHRITKYHEIEMTGDEARCPCGKVIGKISAGAVRMNQSTFTYSGTKRKKQS